MRFVYLLAGLIAALVLAAAAACGDGDDGGGEATPTDAGATTAATTAPPDDSAFPLNITDDAGMEITFDEAPDQIVALAPSFVEVLYAVGAGDSIVAADENTDAPPEAAGIPKVSGYEPSVEAIAGYEPDLVLMCCFDAGGLQGSLTGLDIPTLFFDSPATVEGVYEQIVSIGQVVGHGAEAETLVSEMEADIDAVIAELDDVTTGPSVFHEIDNTLYTAGPGSFVDEVYGMLKATNIAEATGAAYPQMSAEAVIGAAPQVIILADGDYGESAETVAARAGWNTIPAVVNARVYPVPGALLSRPSPRLVEDIQLLATLLYPEQYPQ